MRLLALWAVLFAVYAAATGVGGAADDEDAYLRIAQTLVDGGGLAREPQGAGFPLAIAGPLDLGGTRAVELAIAALAALAFVLAALLARRIVPEPYASGGAALTGLSAPAVAHASAVLPGLVAGTLLAGAALSAVAAREAPRAAPVLGGAALLALVPWLDPLLAVAAAPPAAALYVWCRRAGRPLLALIAVEVIAASVVVYATVNERLYGGPTPWSADGGGTGAEDAGGYLERIPRLAELWIDREAGALRWAPVLGLVFFAGALLWRSRRERLARVVPARATAEAAAALALAICGAQLLVAAFLVSALAGDWFPARHLSPALPAAAALVAWGIRHAPRTGAALGALSLATSAWLLAAGDPWSPPDTSAPWGPLEAAVPWAAALAVVLGVAVAARRP